MALLKLIYLNLEMALLKTDLYENSNLEMVLLKLIYVRIKIWKWLICMTNMQDFLGF